MEISQHIIDQAKSMLAQCGIAGWNQGCAWIFPGCTRGLHCPRVWIGGTQRHLLQNWCQKDGEGEV